MNMRDLPYQQATSIPAAVTVKFPAGFPALPASQDVVQAEPMPSISAIRLLLYVAGNAGVTIRFDAALTGDPIVDDYRPRTALGVKLLALRRAYIENGGKLLNDAAFEAELRSRRGGVDA